MSLTYRLKRNHDWNRLSGLESFANYRHNVAEASDVVLAEVYDHSKVLLDQQTHKPVHQVLNFWLLLRHRFHGQKMHEPLKQTSNYALVQIF
jgi:hypothetical protein